MSNKSEEKETIFRENGRERKSLSMPKIPKVAQVEGSSRKLACTHFKNCFREPRGHVCFPQGCRENCSRGSGSIGPRAFAHFGKKFAQQLFVSPPHSRSAAVVLPPGSGNYRKTSTPASNTRLKGLWRPSFPFSHGTAEWCGE